MPASYFLEEYIMKKIAILRCLKTSASCAGAGFLRAFYEKDKAFAQSVVVDVINSRVKLD